MAPDPNEPVVAVRGFNKLKRELERYGNDIKAIRDKGFVATTNRTERLVFRGMYHNLQDVYNKFVEKWDDACDYSETHSLDPMFPSDADCRYFSSIKNCFYEATGYHLQIEALTSPSPRSSNVNSTLNASAVSQAPPVRTILPRIKIKPFNGNFSQWPTFKQLFTALIKEEASLSNAERFQFLVTYLEGPALDVIKHINVTADNFDQAWSALLKIYDDNRKIALHYLEQILSFKPLSGKPTADVLQSFLSSVTESITSLKNLTIPDIGDYLLCELALRGLDPGNRELFESSIIGTTFPTSDKLKEFVQNRCSILRLTAKDIAPKVESTKSFSKPKSPNDFSSKSHALLAQSTKEPNHNSSSRMHVKSPKSPESGELSCFVCKGKHTVSDCFKFKSATPVQRLDLLRNWSGCRNCLHPFHKTRDCSSQWRCRECKGRHHSWLHLPVADGESHQLASSSNPSTSRSEQPATSNSPPAFSGANTSTSNSGVLLGTVVAHIRNSRGFSQPFRGILDPGSHYSFITETCARKLGKSSKPFNGSISGVNQSPLSHACGIVKLSFLPTSSLSSKPLPLETDAVVVPTITSSLPPVPLHSSMWIDYQSFNLSDPNFTKPGPISFLIGADLFPDVVVGAPITIHATGPKLISTVFGFTVIGRYDDEHESSKSVSLLSIASNPEFSIERFWEIEEPSVVRQHLSPEDERCETHFIHSHRRTSDGRYIVSLPFKDDRNSVVPNIPRALSRFYALENKLAKDDQLRLEYVDFMRQYLDLGHMSPATTEPCYVIPHHPVLKIDPEGNRKLRVVFDASFRSSSGSLNDHLLTGCKLQADICEIMLNFRRFKFVLTCDVVKMFRQIIVERADRSYQQIIWRFDPSEPISFFELNTVTYGIRSSPYQAQRVLKQLVQDDGGSYPLAAEALSTCLYVDDVACGSNDLDGLFDLKSQLIKLLSLGGFTLSKWNSNHPPLLLDECVSSDPVPLGNEEGTAKILGMQWNPTTDNFSYKVDDPPVGCTKRVILSAIARLYDPLGYLSPAVFYAKCILQETWKSGVGWDEEVPNLIRTKWDSFINCLQALTNIIIPRALPQAASYDLVCFSDASERGYCGVVYLRATHAAYYSLTLIKSKTKLAPLKMLTVPRLELCAALLLTEVISSVEQLTKKLNITTTFCFTDSTVVLCWLNTPPHSLQTFVANRVQQITDRVDPTCWYHIKGVENPADIGSRGILPSELPDHTLWWNGPSWCCKPTSEWPTSRDVAHPSDLPELKQPKVSLLTVYSHDEFIAYMHRHSSYLRLVRVVAYIKRFVANCRIPARRKRRRIKGPISSVEFDSARKQCIRAVQHHYFPQVFAGHESNDLPLELRRLAVFTDHDNLVRVGGRLANAPIASDHKFPLLLPTKAHFTSLVVAFLHKSNHHLGPTGLLATLRQQYWVPRAKNLVKLHKAKCVVCVRYSKSFTHPFMGDLPPARFNSVRPFLNTGVDFAGPFLCKASARRNAPSHKSYLCLFICLSTRALHLELATSLTVGGFLDAFERFTARRGLPAHMFSDCGTNFQGTARYLREISEWIGKEEVRSSIEDRTSHLSVRWSFNPPFSPHFGGGWEAGVRSLKNLLHRSFGNQPYTESELSTMFTKAEGILNSRPLQQLSDSPEDLEPLTPGHFLIGQPLNALPEPDLSDVPTNRLDKWQQIRQRIQFFWSRWREEYLSTLQLRQKWNKRTPNLKIDDLVILTDRSTSPMHWPMARVIDVHPGRDDIVRVVTLKTAKGTFKRPTVNLISLPVSSDS